MFGHRPKQVFFKEKTSPFGIFEAPIQRSIFQHPLQQDIEKYYIIWVVFYGADITNRGRMSQLSHHVLVTKRS